MKYAEHAESELNLAFTLEAFALLNKQSKLQNKQYTNGYYTLKAAISIAPAITCP